MIQNLYSASGDKILLLSGGPESHHAKKKSLCIQYEM